MARAKGNGHGQSLARPRDCQNAAADMAADVTHACAAEAAVVSPPPPFVRCSHGVMGWRGFSWGAEAPAAALQGWDVHHGCCGRTITTTKPSTTDTDSALQPTLAARPWREARSKVCALFTAMSPRSVAISQPGVCS